MLQKLWVSLCLSKSQRIDWERVKSQAENQLNRILLNQRKKRKSFVLSRKKLTTIK